MTDDYREHCLHRADRASNEELAALWADAIDARPGAREQLALQVLPLLLAFYEGQVQAGCLLQQAVDDLVQQAWLTVCQRCTGYDPQSPFRAWLIDIARHTLVEHRRNPVTFNFQVVPDTRRARARAH
jgi:RNA polymerase sigma-70 factor (ECF subfamily)